MKTKKWKIGLVEDQQKYRDQIQVALEKDSKVDKLYIWNSAEEFWRDKLGMDLDLIFIDILLPHMNGVDLIRLINERNPEIAKIILTNVTQEEIIFRALRFGAIGYILKNELEKITQYMHTVMDGGAVISPTIALRVMNSFKASRVEGYPELTCREQQVLELLINGQTKQEAAKSFGITENTLKWHVKNIYIKLNVTSKLELLKRCNELELI